MLETKIFVLLNNFVFVFSSKTRYTDVFFSEMEAKKKNKLSAVLKYLSKIGKLSDSNETIFNIIDK